jgi:hypothetical protein
MGRTRVKDEGRLDLDRENGMSLGAEPASGRELASVEASERSCDVGSGRTDRGAQILSITCLTTV